MSVNECFLVFCLARICVRTYSRWLPVVHVCSNTNMDYTHPVPHVKEAERATAYYKARYPTEIPGFYFSTRPKDRMLSYQSSQVLVIHTRISVLQVGAGRIDVYGPAASSNP